MRAVCFVYTILATFALNAGFNGAYALAPQSPALRVAPHLSERTLDDESKAAYFTADTIERTAQGELHLKGNAQVRRIDSVAKGQHIRYNQNTGDISVTGDGTLSRAGNIIRSPSINYNQNQHTGHIESPDFWLGGAGGSGRAQGIDLLSQDHMRMHTVEYTGCPCPDPVWYIRSPQVDLYQQDNKGVAKHGVLYFKNVPILYSPYLSFPLREERKSGILVPTYGYSSNSGLELAVPYYLNLAPNYDATFTPRYLSKRGLQLQAEGRYLTAHSMGQINGAYLARDRQTKTDRWAIGAEHAQHIGGGFAFDYSYNRVSDDNYFRDLSTFGLNQASITELLSTARFSWSGAKYFTAALSVSQYQSLQDAENDYRQPEYNRLPQFELHGTRYNWNGFNVKTRNAAAHFVMPYYTGSLSEFDYYRTTRLAPNSTRISSYTTIERPIVRPAWYVTPKMGLHFSHYRTNWSAVNQLEQRSLKHNVSRFLPIYSLDTGLSFERQTTLFNIDSVQTLEPRLYYLYVPYRDQNAIPNLDTSVATFNFSQAFSENIYSGGWDRIANANQLTAGLTSRWLDADTGVERLRLETAQRFYFEDQRVLLGSSDDPHIQPSGRRRSDYLFGAYAALTDQFSLRLDAQLNASTFDRNRMHGSITWQPQRLASLSVAYRYERDPRAFYKPNYQFASRDDDQTKEQLSLTTQWPLSRKLYALGRVDYSLQEKRTTQSILGFEYKGECCWTGRAVVQRYAVSPGKSNSAVFLQLELSGLGSLGTDPMSLLRERIVGYESVNSSLREKTVFERYE